MTLDLSKLNQSTRLLFTLELQPLQGDRFQPTGFPSLGAATYQTRTGTKLLVESAQSMANRLEAACWDGNHNAPVRVLEGVSHVRVTRKGNFLTDSMLEAHRINSPYLIENKTDTSFLTALKADLGGLESGPIDRKRLAETLLKYDVGSLIHGVFLAKKELAGGRLRVARALSAFIEASGVRIAASGGVKNDHVNPKGDTSTGFGNVPFARDEFTAERINLHVNFDLAQIRGYGLGEAAEQLLVLLGMYRVRRLIDGDLRLRTACDLAPVERSAIVATNPEGFGLPPLAQIETALSKAIAASSNKMVETTVSYEAEIKSAKEKSEGDGGDDADEGDEN
ncbi:MAG: type I-U CRISPR-associated protein Cas7 [Deltaproteobacteria bacterium]|nr:type I-U CRISPR-associated protein Cas7 [Deltaproteobacteria bacterium]